MALSLPVLAVLGIVLFLIVRQEGMKFWHSAVAMMLGFQLSHTILATEVNSAVGVADHFLTSIFAW